MLSKVAQFIDTHQLLRRGGRYLVALSGGADSVALLFVLRQLGYAVEAVHCNFRLRGEESDRDEQFCATLCEHEQITLHKVHFDTRTYAAVHKISIETAARNLRYAYFEQLRQDIGADGICVAHHMDDQAETVLMNIVRGTGLRGLTGMAPKRGYVVRPFLGVRRAEIEQWLSERGQSYMTDSSNLTDEVTRNKIRLNVLPLLNDINPCVTENIVKMSQWMVEVEKIVNQTVHPMTDIVVSELMRHPSPEYVLYVSLRPYGFSADQVRQIMASLPGEPGREWQSATHQLVIDRNRLLIEPLQQELPTMLLPETGTYVYDKDKKIKVEIVDKTADFCIEKVKNKVFFDAGKVFFPLTVRPVRAGDRFYPFGMKGSKLLSDYMTDRKLSLFDKRRQLVVEDAHGEIVWVVCERSSECCRVTEKTLRVLCLSVL